MISDKYYYQAKVYRNQSMKNASVKHLTRELVFVYRYLPIDEKLSLPLCALSDCVVNPGRLRRQKVHKPLHVER